MSGAAARATFSLTIEGLADLDPWMEAAMAAWDPPIAGAAPFRARVIAAEIAANAREHGGAEATPIHVVLTRMGGDTVTLGLAYGGQPFDVSHPRSPPNPAGLDDAAPGGRGLRTVQRLATSLSWAWTGDRNGVEALVEGGPLRPSPDDKRA